MELAIGRYERAFYGIIAILAVTTFAILSIATYTTNVEAYTFFLFSLVALVVMGLCLVGFKIVKAVLLRNETPEMEETTEDEGESLM